MRRALSETLLFLEYLLILAIIALPTALGAFLGAALVHVIRG